MLTLSDFSVTEKERGILEEHDVESSSVELLRVLELYKFRTRKEIVEVLNSKDDEKCFVELSEYVEDARFVELEKKYGVLLQSEGPVVSIYAKAFDSIERNSLELDLGNYSTVLYRLTPMNFEEICGDSALCYDADILFRRILLEVIRLKGTDLHFDVIHKDMKPVYTVSYRRDADLLPLQLFDLDADLNARIIQNLIERKTSNSSMDLIQPAGVIANADDIFGDGDVELRITANKVQEGFHYVIRIQQKQTFNFSIKGLGFEESVNKDLFQILDKRSGITLITGAIRTGKNTTAYALLNTLVKEPVKMISYESPIEVLMPFSQVNYFDDADSLLNAVRLAKKQDINIAFINEIPNKEVAFALQDLANSSIHVISTMHVDRAWHLPYKLKEYFGDNYKDVISQINGIFNQKMFGVPCPACSEQYLVEDIDNEIIRDFISARGMIQYRKSKGCALCNGTGKILGKNQPYSEHLVLTDKIKSELLQCEHPFEMEVLIKKYLQQTKHCLEDYMFNGIRAGKLAIDTLKFIL